MYSNGRSNGTSKSRTEQKAIVYHPRARDELIEAAQFYEERSIGLGEKFLDRVENALDFIRENPTVFPGDEKGRRKYIIKKFPYLLIYKIREESIFILAVAHGSRKPGT